MAYLRLTAGRHPRDARLAELIGELAMRSSEFATLWAQGEVADCTAADVDYQVWLQPDSPDHRLKVYTPRDASSADALRLLATGLEPDTRSMEVAVRTGRA